MLTTAPKEITQLLLAWSRGDRSALDRLIPLVYEELRRMARYYMGQERPGHTLQTTALVNEAYLRLIDSSQLQWQNRAHFFAVTTARWDWTLARAWLHRELNKATASDE